MRHQMRLRHVSAISLLAVSMVATTPAQPLTSALLLNLPPGFEDAPQAVNPVAAMLVKDDWKAPAAGDKVTFSGKECVWKAIQAGPDGWFPDSLFRGRSYVYVAYDAPAARVALLEGMGDDMVFVNGSPRTGNPYGYTDNWGAWEPRFDYSELPVLLKRGTNHLLFHVSRGRFRATLAPATKEAFFNMKDTTAPDMVVGKPLDACAAVTVVNATTNDLRDCVLRWEAEGRSSEQAVTSFIPLSVRKQGFPLRLPARASVGEVVLRLSLLRGEHTVDTATMRIRVVEPDAPRKETFISSLDGSVQYYAVNPPNVQDGGKKALIFSLHGAGVEAISQARSYEAKPWAWIIAPTNRRPYGFNWEDWGRLDAMEVLRRVLQEFSIDTTTVYLTGHSMGGHGTWQIGSLLPDRFAAIGPSAGWITYWSYRIREHPAESTPVARMFRRANATSETPLFARNLYGLGVYILHGEIDDNVPIRESYLMADTLKAIHKNFEFHIQPGANHWWDVSHEPGADCVDWAPMMDFFLRHRRPSNDETRLVEFLTANPGVSSTYRWVTVAQQEHPLRISTVSVRFDPGLREFSGTTKNLRLLGFDSRVIPAGDSLLVTLDSTIIRVKYPSADQPILWLMRTHAAWVPSGPPAPTTKSPLRYGPFKDAFRHAVVLVYGTHGSREENALLLDQVRYDAEKWWYQANGSVDIVADANCTPAMTKGRNIILYGNAATNSVWKTFLQSGPVEVERRSVRVGRKVFKGDDQCALFVRPQAGSETLSVAAVAATGAEGIRLLSRVQYFNAYLGMPDLLVMNSGVVGHGDKGVECIGFFGNDWTVDHGDFDWSNETR
jgi:poly(3-hydroxybutyrate) depolymerase